MIVDHELGLTILGRCGLPPVRLVVENTRSVEWESLPRQGAAQGEGAVGATQADKSSVQTVSRRFGASSHGGLPTTSVSSKDLKPPQPPDNRLNANWKLLLQIA